MALGFEASIRSRCKLVFEWTSTWDSTGIPNCRSTRTSGSAAIENVAPVLTGSRPASVHTIAMSTATPAVTPVNVR